MATSLTLKVDLSGDVRRCRLKDGSEHMLENFLQAICVLFGVPAGSLSLQYRDDEGDLCSLVEATLGDALAHTKASGVLRLVATHVASPPSPTVPPASSVGLGAGGAEELAAPSSQAAQLPPSTSELAASAELAEVTAATFDAEATAADAMAAAEAEAAQAAAPQEAPRTPGCGFLDRLERAKPRLSEHAQSFKQQVFGDFQESREDMKKAFVADEGESTSLKTIGNAIGFATGLLVAARMAPVRATRLVAESAAALSVEDAPASVSSAAAADVPATDASGEASRTASAAAPATDAAVDSELGHLAEQVKNDFHTSRREVRDVLGYMLGGTTSVGQPDGQRRRPEDERRDQLPALASTVAGVAVAASLVPLRAVRAGVAAGSRGLRTRSAAAAAGTGGGSATSDDWVPLVLAAHEMRQPVQVEAA